MKVTCLAAGEFKLTLDLQERELKWHSRQPEAFATFLIPPASQRKMAALSKPLQRNLHDSIDFGTPIKQGEVELGDIPHERHSNH